MGQKLHIKSVGIIINFDAILLPNVSLCEYYLLWYAVTTVCGCAIWVHCTNLLCVLDMNKSYVLQERSTVLPCCTFRLLLFYNWGVSGEEAVLTVKRLGRPIVKSCQAVTPMAGPCSRDIKSSNCKKKPHIHCTKSKRKTIKTADVLYFANKYWQKTIYRFTQCAVCFTFVSLLFQL